MWDKRNNNPFGRETQAAAGRYVSTLNWCLQGIVSPATLGIDVGKMASADAQREKKDVTGYTRNSITGALEKALPKLIEALLVADDLMKGHPAGKYEAAVDFGEYGAPDFDSRVQTVAAAASAGLMSTETQVNELWGGSKTKEWCAEETARILQEKGTTNAPEPAVGEVF